MAVLTQTKNQPNVFSAKLLASNAAVSLADLVNIIALAKANAEQTLNFHLLSDN